MAVPAYKRQDNKLEVLNMASAVFEDAVRLIKQDDMLSKKNCRIMGEPLITNIRQMMYSITLANNVFVKDDAAAKKRIGLQVEARKYMIMMQVDIQLIMKMTADEKTLLQCSRLLKRVGDLKAKTAAWAKYTLKEYQEKKYAAPADLNTPS